ncbi:MAG: hypothetical protein EOP11_11950, partial [Proteobacteria bacterium]
MYKQKILVKKLAVAGLFLALAFPGAAAAAKASRAKKTSAPPLETYSAYDSSQDPDADQSSTFLEPELLESLDPRNA